MTQEDLAELSRTRPAPAEADADGAQEAPAKRIKLDETAPAAADSTKAEDVPAERKRGTAPIKKEYLISVDQNRVPNATPATADDDAAEAAPYHEREYGGDSGRGGKKSKRSQQGKGQNTNRKFNKAQDEKGLCSTRQYEPEFSPKPCQFGDTCRFEHDLRKYLKDYKREDLTTFNGLCPVWDVYGVCFSGWKCRFVGSHMKERELENGRKELYLVEDEERKKAKKPAVDGVTEAGVVNSVATEHKAALMRKKYALPKSDAMIKWLDTNYKEARQNEKRNVSQTDGQATEGEAKEHREENRARYTEPPLLPSEKRSVYFGPEMPVVAPLTTQGNLPFRRLCVDLGAQFTYSEMAMSLPLIQGHKGEWALMKAHESEALPPTLHPGASIVKGYDQTRDMKFGVQIAASKPWQALKATEALTALCPHVRVVDLNCGCPIDLVFQSGGGSALLDQHAKLEKILRGMNTVSGEVPVSVKIRMGTKDNSPTALKLAERLILGGHEAQEQGLGPAGVAAITLHGRSRQQRYTRSADWGYIAECAALIKRLNEKTDAVTDTVREPDARYQPAAGKVFFLGNGDCYSYEDYNRAINEGGVDSVMIGRGALMKPWLFEEIQAGQYLDKSASERLTYIEKFVKYGLEAWGSDEQGVGTTRRFLLEWLSFTRRYIPIGLLEHLPPSMQDRPPAYRGRNELETLMASDNYKDWIKISEMFLGPVHKDFQFTPKHKSNSYDVEAEG